MAESPESRFGKGIIKGLDSKTLSTGAVVGYIASASPIIQSAFFDLCLKYVHYLAMQYDQGLLDHMPELLRIGHQCKELTKK